MYTRTSWFRSIKATIEVLKMGVIFGGALLKGLGRMEVCIVLNDVHVDIMDYFKMV